MKSVDMPGIDYDGMEADEALMKFYKTLGFNPKKHTLDPKKVKISSFDFLRMTEKMKSLNPDNTTEASLMMLNYGPSGDNNMEYGKVHLYSGWITAG